jgi:hypothetical protein
MTVQQWMNSPEKSEVFKPFPQEGDIEIGLVRFDDAAQVFRIYMGAEYNGTYNMEADRILSGAGCFDFLLQVHSKEWVTGQHLKYLLDCIACWVYRDHGKFPQQFFNVAGGMARGLDEPDVV